MSEQPIRNRFGYASHFPILAGVIARAGGDVLELGCGEGSTPLLHYMSGHNGFGKLLTIEMDPYWAMQFNLGYYGDCHDFLKLTPKDDSVQAKIDAWVECMDSVEPAKWQVAFIDFAPGEGRVPVIKKLKGLVDYIVVHDTEGDEPGGGGNYGWKQLDGMFKYQSIFKRFRPWTTVYSDLYDFHIEECDR